jgi:hypothetical protein
VIEICLGITPFMQPSPAKNPGGDCFACALTAALRWVYQKPDLSFERCWQFFEVDTAGGSRALSNCWHTMRSALYAADSEFFELGRLEIANDLVIPTFDPETYGHCWFQGHTTEYAHRLEGWLRGGWVALSEIDHAGRGPVVDGRWNVNDHFVAIDGVRSYWKPVAAVPGAASLTSDVHVVCSSRGAYWIPLDDFLFKHGAAAWWLVRKDQRQGEPQ